MVNGNYVLYGDKPASESEMVDDHVHARTTERKAKRKVNRSANELQYSLNLAQLDNETDSVKYEKKTKEPRLLRYVPTTDVEEHFVSEKFETYDLKPAEEPPRRYAFAKKPKNPSDGSVNYAYSRSSSSCSSPNGNLPTISEHGEQYGTYRIRAIRTGDEEPSNTYETKLDKYFARPRDVKPFVAKGSHPDSLYRVPMGSSVSASKVVRVLRVLRWPVALFSVCIALAIFVYFLMPDNLSSEFDTVNATDWQKGNANAQSHRNPEKPGRKPPESNGHSLKGSSRTKPQEIDFYDAETATGADLTSRMEAITERIEKIKTPAPPVFPTHLTPEVQYGNEKADTGKPRNPKLIDQATTKNDESTLKPHITQSPEKPLAIYFDEGKVVAATTAETITRAESSNDVFLYDEKQTTNKVAEGSSSKAYSPVYKDTSLYMRNENTHQRQRSTESDLTQELHNYYQLAPLNPDNRFTSGHSKLFGISIEDAAKMKSTTQSSLYNTRVSPTLPTWRDKVDSTTKNYPLNINLDVSQCRSTRLALCRGVLPYDLAGPAVTLDGVEITELLPQIEYLIATNCSDRVAQFLCALLEPECSPAPYPSKMPCYHLCRAVAESCEGSIPRELVDVFGCTRYPANGCATARAPCGPRELPCADSSCVPTHWACDGAPDCPAGEDEAHCTACSPDEFQCMSGGCVRSRWVCDGYSDCPRGEDEAENVCGRPQAEDTEAEPGEESAGSSPALAVHRPNRLPETNADHSIHRTGEAESSKELLITSDSNNSFKRNFTRRPSPSRLTPYSRPIIHDSKATTSEREKMDTAAKTKISEVKVTKSYSDSTKRKHIDLAASKTSARGMSHPMEPTPPTHLDKSIHNLERVINGAAMMKKTAEAQEDMTDSSEGKDTNEKAEDAGGRRGSAHYEGPVRAHTSPCPSGELRCVDGRCITLAQLCDGTIDCSDHADEDNCYT